MKNTFYSINLHKCKKKCTFAAIFGIEYDYLPSHELILQRLNGV